MNILIYRIFWESAAERYTHFAFFLFSLWHPYKFWHVLEVCFLFFRLRNKRCSSKLPTCSIQAPIFCLNRQSFREPKICSMIFEADILRTWSAIHYNMAILLPETYFWEMIQCSHYLRNFHFYQKVTCCKHCIVDSFADAFNIARAVAIYSLHTVVLIATRTGACSLANTQKLSMVHISTIS